MRDLQFRLGVLRKRGTGLIQSAWFRNPLRTWRIAGVQKRTLASQSTVSNRAIVFIVPGFDRVDGGILSLSSLVDETRKLAALHGAEVFACPFPGDPPLAAYTQFDNNLRLVAYRQLMAALGGRRPEVLIHIPEVYVAGASERLKLRALRERGIQIRINILLQNIDHAPGRGDIDRLREIAEVTITTAHKAYSTPEVAKRFGGELFHLSVWNTPERYEITAPSAKKDIILLSPDEHPQRAWVLTELKRSLPDFEFRVVENMPYREYRALCSAARLAITFGEGLDGYYIESIFSGGVSSAVYNERFFLPKYRGLPLMYENWNELVERLPPDFLSLKDEQHYLAAHRRQLAVAGSDYPPGEYTRNLKEFYSRLWAASAERAEP
jgi:hypothetical protein